MTATESRSQGASQHAADRRPHLMLGMAAVGFAVTFWA